jgi:hypothetical protein
MLVQGKRPWFALGVDVEECFLRCAKPLVRSHLWEIESWPDLATVPTGADLLRACLKIDQPLEEIAASLARASVCASTERERWQRLGPSIHTDTRGKPTR